MFLCLLLLHAPVLFPSHEEQACKRLNSFSFSWKSILKIHQMVSNFHIDQFFLIYSKRSILRCKLEDIWGILTFLVEDSGKKPYQPGNMTWRLWPRPHVSGYFWKRIFFYPFWVPVHTETAFSVTENEAFRKRSPEWIFLKTPFSCCRVDGWKRSFSKTLTSRHRFTTYQSMPTDLWGQQKGILIVCFLLSKFEQRNLNVAASSCGRGYFRKRSSCGRESFENG